MHVDIKRELDTILDSVYAEMFGTAPLAALPLQREVLRMRLAAFAEKQAELFAEGWQIVAVEQECEMPFIVDGAPSDVILRGKIDRIDFHPASGQWRVLDYKTGSVIDPTRKHFSKTQGWKDLQFPLYAKLLEGLARKSGESEESIFPSSSILSTLLIEYSYFHLPAELDKVGVSKPFDPAKIEEGQEEAARIVREVTSGEGCRDIGKLTHYDSPTFVALCGGKVTDDDDDG